MSAFLTDLITKISRPGTIKRNLYTLTESFVYQSEILGRVEVHAGFTTDFASIPRIAWRYIDPEDPCICYPSVIHDFLYTTQPCSREVADRVLAEAMQVAGARLDQRVVVHKAVSWFGSGHWKEI